MNFLILPNQLFDKKYLDKENNYYIWEHPHYFLSYNFNKKKLMLHRASLQYYFDYLKKAKFNVKYFTYKQDPKLKDYYLFDPIDKPERLKLKGKFTLLDSPNFLLSHEDQEAYRKKTNKFLFNNFYMWSKKRLDILPGVKSQDKNNRKRLPKGKKIPSLPTNKSDDKYINEAKKYVEKNFKDNYGNTDNFIYPISHTTAKKWLKNFVDKRFKEFGDYEDFMDKSNGYLFHSVLSSIINIGILNPKEIVEYIHKFYDEIPLNSYEGYIRQLFWREYQRYCYYYYDFLSTDYFGNKKKLTKAWYTGETGIPIIDDSIKFGFDTGYLHHIYRLMVIGNYMNLSGISPKEGFKWFMEFSCDSYEWVMHQNVYDMVFFVSGGATMRRPYVSSSNYIIKMSNYKKGEWSEDWNKLYKEFLKKHYDKLWKFRYYFRGLKNIKK